MSPKNTVSDVIEAKKCYGFSGIPITPDGQMGSQLLGLVTQRDIDFVDPSMFNTPLEQVMGPSHSETLFWASWCNGFGWIKCTIYGFVCRFEYSLTS